MSIENGRQKPSYNLLYRLVRELSIPANLIFYPEIAENRLQLVRATAMLHRCGDKELNIIVSLIQSLLNE